MARYKTFDATGLAPAGKLFAGDLNAIQDMKADLTDLDDLLAVVEGMFFVGMALPYFGEPSSLSGEVEVRADWLLVNGASLLISAFPDLWNFLGPAYGQVDGTHFNLPPNGRALIGKKSSGIHAVRGNIGGEENHALTAAENGPHTHQGWKAAGNFGLQVASTWFQGLIRVHDASQTGVTDNGSGSGTPHNNMPPYVTIGGYIIKAR